MTMFDPGLDLPPLELTVRSHPRSVTETRKKVAEYAEAGGANRSEVELAVAEAVSNAVVHAFEGRDDGVITVGAEIHGPNQLVVQVADNGSGMTTLARSPGAGFGLPIIGALTDSVEIYTGAQGTRLELRFSRAAAGAAVLPRRLAARAGGSGSTRNAGRNGRPGRASS